MMLISKSVLLIIIIGVSIYIFMYNTSEYNNKVIYKRCIIIIIIIVVVVTESSCLAEEPFPKETNPTNTATNQI